MTLTLFPSGVNLIIVTLAPIPGALWVDTGRGVPNSHITTDPSMDPVKSEDRVEEEIQRSKYRFLLLLMNYNRLRSEEVGRKLGQIN